MDIVALVVVMFVGLCFGSLVNAVVWRVHEQAKIDASKQKYKKEAKKRYSIVTARSMCPHCGHELSVLDLVPIFSWLFLRGRCRYCKAPISAQYPIVEAIGAVAAGLSYLAWPYDLDAEGIVGLAAFGLWLIVLTILLALAVYDSKFRILPDRLVVAATFFGVVMVLLLAITAGDRASLYNAAFGGIFLAGLFFVLFQVSGGRWIGGGDVKLGFLLGLLAGSLLHAVLLLFIASVLGTLYTLIAALVAKTHLSPQAEIAFGPWLIIATYVAFLWAPDIITWYSGLLSTI